MSSYTSDDFYKCVIKKRNQNTGEWEFVEEILSEFKKKKVKFLFFFESPFYIRVKTKLEVIQEAVSKAKEYYPLKESEIKVNLYHYDMFEANGKDLFGPIYFVKEIWRNGQWID